MAMYDNLLANVPTDLWIGGKWRKSSDGGRFDVIDPATENKVGFARQFYNDIATKFNTAQQVFPTNIFANMFGFKAAELFEIAEAADRAVPVVDLSRKQ